MERVLVVKLPEYGEGARLIYSAYQRDQEESHGQFWITSNVSFAYVTGNCAAEWEPQYGPIQVWNGCEKDDDGAKEHYIFDYHNSQPLNWSQLAVDENRLKQAAINGNWEHIFNVLKRWSVR